ncbi:hypothetical protein DFR24_0607 [Panacagrimonas perspica]|uniref:Uncharacterized protein n=1 Tax=Panacagrimonas perspica TaxID=381431 RepID=A0A4R7PAZ3_9GAMM|nr:DUF4331 domain-containing protein [Panacagrimonas perspica]TDU31243.1 hypothetical protein DFR24_0607 [Panacagrimonas perspica]THD02593.1 hypothetical protein B1810_13660 [Panacagrimonas perspica]
MNARQILLGLTLGGSVALVGCGDGHDSKGGDNGGAPELTGFDFRSDPIPDFDRVDRMGGPATTTALLTPGPTGGARRQVANATDPADDSQYAAEYITAIKRYHYHLGPALAATGLATCGVVGLTEESTGVGACVLQALANPVIPDVLRLDTRQLSDYPNGRKPDDPVVDVLLAIALLDLGGDGNGPGTCLGSPCTRKSIANVPLNVARSTPPSLPAFPYLNNQQLAPPPSASR